ncbi:unnamed protein product [Leptosia nina]|uniref:Uncharacterized protein n=1 Tax=Leptosia nina TaxID=320188 RepID=A0AAV1JVN3_9NEOP
MSLKHQKFQPFSRPHQQCHRTGRTTDPKRPFDHLTKSHDEMNRTTSQRPFHQPRKPHTVATINWSKTSTHITHIH